MCAQRAVLIAQPHERLLEQQDQGVIGHSGIADASTGGHDGARERLRPIETARDIRRAETSRASRDATLDTFFKVLNDTTFANYHDVGYLLQNVFCADTPAGTRNFPGPA